ncbi:MAG: isoprenylcysteine carboxylmethyltransferase family protein [Chloroherpetonaceae bacterium]|nr:isoprenylcysteine carboxylmethyltransferase family protein [Chloroherpetonaceae bacterium]
MPITCSQQPIIFSGYTDSVFFSKREKTMGVALRLTFLVFALILAVASLVLVPAALCGIMQTWQVYAACLFYFLFFLSTIARVRKYGDFSPRSQDAQVQSKWGKVAYPIQFLGLGGAHWLAVYDFSQHLRTVSVWSVLGVLVMLVALVVNRLAARELGRFWDQLLIKDEHYLVTTGIYRIVRHPIYTSYILLFCGNMVLFESLWAMLLLIVVCTIWFGTRIRIEESLLLRKFGNEYAEYMRQTKRLFPYLF